MTYIADRIANMPFASAEAVPNAVSAFKLLSTDDQLGLLWVIYTKMGSSITPAAPGAARLQFAEGLIQQVRSLPAEEQLKAMRDLANKVSTPIARAYGVLSNNNKLAFWYQLAELMKAGEVIPVPSGYKLSQPAETLLNRLVQMEFGQQITFLRQAVVNMGVDPLA